MIDSASTKSVRVVMSAIGKIRFELSELLGIDVDALIPGALPELLREKVLAEARPV